MAKKRKRREEREEKERKKESHHSQQHGRAEDAMLSDINRTQRGSSAYPCSYGEAEIDDQEKKKKKMETRIVISRGQKGEGRETERGWVTGLKSS